MYNVVALDNLDFYFNGRWLSEFNGIIAGKNGLAPFSSIPSKEISTEKILGVDGELVTNVRYNPRTFVVPVLFNDLTKLRDISAWLGVRQPTDFYFKNDTVKISCMIDSAIDIENYNMAGTVELKFIAHNPYYYAVNDIKYIFAKFDRGFSQIDPLQIYNTVNITQYDRYTPATYEVVTVDTQTMSKNTTWQLYTDGTVTKNGSVITMEVTSFATQTLFNDGNCDSFPLIKVVGTGNITVGINGDAFTVNNVVDYCYIDSYYYSCYRDSTNKINDFSGNFLKLKTEYNTISVVSTGTITSIELQCNSKWI